MMIYPKESVVSYYLSRIPAENQCTCRWFGQKKSSWTVCIFNFGVYDEIQICWVPYVGSTPPDAIVAFMKGLGCDPLHAPQTTRVSTCDLWKPSAWDRPVTYIKCLFVLSAPQRNVRNIMCGATSTQSTKALFGKCFMQSEAKLLDSELDEIICRNSWKRSIYIVGSPVQDTPFMLHVMSKWGLQTLQKVVVIMTAPRLSVVHVDFSQMLMLQSHWNSHF